MFMCSYYHGLYPWCHQTAVILSDMFMHTKLSLIYDNNQWQNIRFCMFITNVLYDDIANLNSSVFFHPTLLPTQDQITHIFRPHGKKSLCNLKLILLHELFVLQCNSSSYFHWHLISVAYNFACTLLLAKHTNIDFTKTFQ